MFEQLDGQLYKQLISYGIRNLKLHEAIVNELNVFPVPDGDTGTNMTMTLTNGFEAIRNQEGDLSDLAEKFSYAVAFGARGNSGVISSQFFKGFSESFLGNDVATPDLFIKALDKGVQEAYKAVSKPTEGTILTVVREATEHVKELNRKAQIESVLDVVNAFLDQAKVSLENTPELLPVLKNAGVVDSGGAGILYFFKGMKKYMMNENVEEIEEANYQNVVIDYSVFNRESKFEYGYCTELLIQLTEGKEPFDYDTFKEKMESMGNSVAMNFIDEKIKLHVHTMNPEEIIAYSHRFGEFLSLKIENMSVQHEHTYEHEMNEGKDEELKEHRKIAIVATASDKVLAQCFKKMGASVTIEGGQSCNPSVQEFVSAFEKVNADNIIVFPNNKNVILTANQATKLYNDARVIVVNSKSMAECYSALGLVDFDSDDLEGVLNVIRESIEQTDIVSVTKAMRNATYDNLKITVEDFVAIDDNEILGLGKSIGEVVFPVLDKCLGSGNKDVVRLCTGKSVKDEEVEELVNYIDENHLYVECEVVKTDSEIYHLILSFE